MQWSSDRNGGFSRADPARLYAPPIMDPVYGYQAINVEAQERYPFSLLNWMKRLIELRRQHQVFGRGAIEFVGCTNRKVLAYLRRDEKRNDPRRGEPVARAAARGYRSVGFRRTTCRSRCAGLTEFPRIGETPYFLTLGAYACVLVFAAAAIRCRSRRAPPSRRTRRQPRRIGSGAPRGARLAERLRRRNARRARAAGAPSVPASPALVRIEGPRYPDGARRRLDDDPKRRRPGVPGDRHRGLRRRVERELLPAADAPLRTARRRSRRVGARRCARPDYRRPQGRDRRRTTRRRRLRSPVGAGRWRGRAVDRPRSRPGVAYGRTAGGRGRYGTPLDARLERSEQQPGVCQ